MFKWKHICQWSFNQHEISRYKKMLIGWEWMTCALCKTLLKHSSYDVTKVIRRQLLETRLDSWSSNFYLKNTFLYEHVSHMRDYWVETSNIMTIGILMKEWFLFCYFSVTCCFKILNGFLLVTEWFDHECLIFWWIISIELNSVHNTTQQFLDLTSIAHVY